MGMGMDRDIMAQATITDPVLTPITAVARIIIATTIGDITGKQKARSDAPGFFVGAMLLVAMT
jgi:hypothetical protein